MQVSILYRHTLLCMLMLLSGCSTVLEGSHQRISVNSVPEGASCILKSNDDVIAEVKVTPEVVVVQKSKYDIVVECTKPGYLKGKNKNHSDYAISSIGNMVFGQFGVLGSMMDTASGAGNKYDAQVFVELEKNTEAPTVTQVVAAPVVPVAYNVPQVLPVALVTAPPAVIFQPQQVAQITEVSVKQVTDGTRQPPFDVTQ